MVLSIKLSGINKKNTVVSVDNSPPYCSYYASLLSLLSLRLTLLDAKILDSKAIDATMYMAEPTAANTVVNTNVIPFAILHILVVITAPFPKVIITSDVRAGRHIYWLCWP